MATWTYTLIGPGAAVEALPEDVGPLTQTTDHAGTALDRLLEQFHDLPRMEALLAALVGTLQPLEDVGWQLLQERYLWPVDGQGPAVGEQLDGLGELLGEPRAGRGDDDYRIFLRVRILVNLSDGLAEDLIEILDTIGHELIWLRETYPASLRIVVTDSGWTLESFRAVRDAKAGGVGLRFIYSEDLDADTFQASGTYATVETSATQGAGSVYDAGVGGRSAGVLS